MNADADPDRAGIDRLLVDDARPPQPFLELGDPLLEQGLLVLGVVVLGVLGDVPEPRASFMRSATSRRFSVWR